MEYEVREGLTLSEAVEFAGDCGELGRDVPARYEPIDNSRWVRPKSVNKPVWSARRPVKTYTAAEALELPVGTVLEKVRTLTRVRVVEGCDKCLCWYGDDSDPVPLSNDNLKGPYRIVEDPI